MLQPANKADRMGHTVAIRKLYAVRRHDGRLSPKRQPGIAAFKAATSRSLTYEGSALCLCVYDLSCFESLAKIS